MKNEEISSLNYLLDALSIAPNKFETLINIVYRTDASDRYIQYLNLLMKSGYRGDLIFHIKNIRNEIK